MSYPPSTRRNFAPSAGVQVSKLFEADIMRNVDHVVEVSSFGVAIANKCEEVLPRLVQMFRHSAGCGCATRFPHAHQAPFSLSERPKVRMRTDSPLQEDLFNEQRLLSRAEQSSRGVLPCEVTAVRLLERFTCSALRCKRDR